MGNKNKKDKKHKCCRRREQRVYIWIGIPVAGFLLSYFLFFSGPTLSTKKILSPPPLPRLTKMVNVNTTSVLYEKNPWYSVDVLSNLLRRHLEQSAEYHVLCMHHLDIKRPYQGCSLRNGKFIYFMLNPVLVLLTGKELVVLEESQSCNGTVPIKRGRTECIELVWTDGTSKLHGAFCGDAAIAIQLALDEFKGNGHCQSNQ